MNLLSFRNLRIEMERLAALEKACDFAFQTVRSVLRKKIHSGAIDPATPAVLASVPNVEVAKNHYALLNKLDSQFPRYIRETLFVRLISTFEVFLVDLVRDIFMHRTDLFHTTKVIEITHAEALSIGSTAHLRERVLAKELRQLHSEGIKGIAKYYERQLKIRFSEMVSQISKLWEMHDRRHLLVHRLGRADSAYRHNYGYTNKGPLSVDQKYLASSTAFITEFAEAIEKQAGKLFAAHSQNNAPGRRSLQLDLEIETASAEAEHVLAPSYPFIVNDRITGERGAFLRDILAHARASENGSVLTLSGDRETVRAYLRQVKKSAKRGLLSIIRKDVLSHSNGSLKDEPATTLDRATIESIARRLPPQPWPKGIHKEIASELSLSNRQCSRAITAVLNDHALYSLVGNEKRG